MHFFVICGAAKRLDGKDYRRITMQGTGNQCPHHGFLSALNLALQSSLCKGRHASWAEPIKGFKVETEVSENIRL